MILTTDCIFLDAEGNPTDAHCDGNSWAESDASRKYLKTVDPKKPLFLDYGGELLQLHRCCRYLPMHILICEYALWRTQLFTVQLRFI